MRLFPTAARKGRLVASLLLLDWWSFFQSQRCEKRYCNQIFYPWIQEENATEHIPILCSKVGRKDTTHTMSKDIQSGLGMAVADFSSDKMKIFHVGMIVIDMARQRS